MKFSRLLNGLRPAIVAGAIAVTIALANQLGASADNAIAIAPMSQQDGAWAGARLGSSPTETIGSAGPLIGLLGTVLGVIDAFLGIATKGSGNIGAVAPGVGGGDLFGVPEPAAHGGGAGGGGGVFGEGGEGSAAGGGGGFGVEFDEHAGVRFQSLARRWPDGARTTQVL